MKMELRMKMGTKKTNLETMWCSTWWRISESSKRADTQRERECVPRVVCVGGWVEEPCAEAQHGLEIHKSLSETDRENRQFSRFFVVPPEESPLVPLLSTFVALPTHAFTHTHTRTHTHTTDSPKYSLEQIARRV
jgi:hypothetical protein